MERDEAKTSGSSLVVSNDKGADDFTELREDLGQLFQEQYRYEIQETPNSIID